MYLEDFESYIPKCKQEAVDKEAIISFINTNKDCLKRTNLIAHITSSALVVNRMMDKVLFIHHNIYNSWGWVGGHNDGNPDLLKVALKEAKEETGVSNITLFNEDIIGIDIIQVKNHIKNGKFVGDHLHLNATFLLIADESEELIVKEDENSDVKWFYIDGVMEYVTEDRIKDVYNKLFTRIKEIETALTK